MRISTNMDKSRPKLAKNVGKNIKMLVGPQYALYLLWITSPSFSLGQNTHMVNQAVSVCLFQPKKPQGNIKKRQKTSKSVKMLVPGPVGPRSRHFLIFLTTDLDSSCKNTLSMVHVIHSEHFIMSCRVLTPWLEKSNNLERKRKNQGVFF